MGEEAFRQGFAAMSLRHRRYALSKGRSTLVSPKIGR
jgi:hypothetical protein